MTHLSVTWGSKPAIDCVSGLLHVQWKYPEYCADGIHIVTLIV